MYESHIFRLTNFSQTPCSKLNPLGMMLMEQVELHLRYYINAKKGSVSMESASANMSIVIPDKFLSSFLSMYEENKDKFSTSFFHGPTEAAIAKISGNPNPELAVKVISFYSVLKASGQKGFKIVSVNLFGPLLCAIQCYNQRERGSSKQAPPFLSDRKDHIKKRLHTFFALIMVDDIKPTFSIAINATKAPVVLQYSRKCGAIIGESTPNQMTIVVDRVSPEQLKTLLDPKGKNIASEVK
jgi:hypothetical protein